MSSPSQATDSNQHPGKRRVLVVDDNQDSATSLAMLVGVLGAESRTAYDGPQALEVAADFRPEMIFLDIGLPIFDGYEAARRIREEPWGKTIVLAALTGWGNEEDRQRSLEAGFDHHLVKPIEINALKQLLSNLPPATAV
ncbi:MAG TPA: response regulator [Pirellulales bacterium]|jgi:CheY-like chemotaxis protein|nr:response regulator [Pirellulales bacterium]